MKSNKNLIPSREESFYCGFGVSYSAIWLANKLNHNERRILEKLFDKQSAAEKLCLSKDVCLGQDHEGLREYVFAAIQNDLLDMAKRSKIFSEDKKKHILSVLKQRARNKIKDIRAIITKNMKIK